MQKMTEQHQKEVLEIMIEAVKGGSTMQEARIGMMIAQFNALPQAIKDEALANAKVAEAASSAPVNCSERFLRLAS